MASTLVFPVAVKCGQVLIFLCSDVHLLLISWLICYPFYYLHMNPHAVLLLGLLKYVI